MASAPFTRSNTVAFRQTDPGLSVSLRNLCKECCRCKEISCSLSLIIYFHSFHVFKSSNVWYLWFSLKYFSLSLFLFLAPGWSEGASRMALFSVQFSSVTQLCPTLCDPMNLSTPGLPIHHQLLEFTQTHVHRVGDAIQPSHPLPFPSPPAPNLSQHQSLFQWPSFR